MPTLVSTGQFTITDLMDGVNARLSQETYVLPTDVNGQVSSYLGCSTTMFVYLGAVDDTINWSFSVQATVGLVGEFVGSTFTVTSLTGNAGYVDITASKAGFPSITSRFSVTKTTPGAAGPTISLVCSGQGFTFEDGVAKPAQQQLSITLIRGQGVTDPVIFRASNGVTLRTNNSELQLANYMLGVPGVGEGETAYFNLAEFGTAKQVTITAFCGNNSVSHTLVRLDFSTAEPGATVGAPSGTLVGSTPAEQVEANANLVTTKLDKASTEILNIDAASATRVAGLRVGDLAWDASGNRIAGKGVAMTPSGLLGHNGSKTTFAINATTGDAVFGGSLDAATGTFSGALSAATGTFSGSLTADAVNAVDTINLAGNSVTIPASAYTAGGMSVPSNRWENVQSLTVTSPGGVPFLLIGGIEFSNQTSNPAFDGYLAISTEVSDAAPAFSIRGNRALCGTLTITPPAGTTTFYLKSKAASGVLTVSQRSLCVIGTKR
jgi:hypothetical protein